MTSWLLVKPEMPGQSDMMSNITMEGLEGEIACNQVKNSTNDKIMIQHRKKVSADLGHEEPTTSVDNLIRVQEGATE